MKHIVLLQYKDKDFLAYACRLAEKQFQILVEKTDYINEVKVIQNCMMRASNADLMIMLDLKDKSYLESYLHHPAHTAFVEETDQYVAQRISFDYEEDSSL